MGLPRASMPFVAGVLAVIVILEGALAAKLYLTQPPRQAGFWDPAGEIAVTGALVTKPYPMIRVAAAGRKLAHLVLLVDEWKFGLPLGPEFHDNDLVRVTGYAIRRADVTVLQVDNKLQRLGQATPPPELDAEGTHTLTGEIVDSKCWTGAMSPGDGKAHKGCGNLCLLGGIPALFIASDANGPTRWYVLSDEHGEALDESIRARVGERLSLPGQIFEARDLHEFRVNTSLLDP